MAQANSRAFLPIQLQSHWGLVMDGVLWFFSQPTDLCRSDRYQQTQSMEPQAVLRCSGTSGSGASHTAVGNRPLHWILAPCIGLGWVLLKPRVLQGKKDAYCGLSDTGTSVCSAGFSGLRLVFLWLSAKTLDLSCVCSSSMPRVLPRGSLFYANSITLDPKCLDSL